MQYMIGYQMQESEALLKEILRYRENVHEVYFSWGTMASGRGGTVYHSRLVEFEAMQLQYRQLKKLSGEGIALNLLLNANCYGKDSLSRSFLMQTGNLVDYLINELRIASVTTTSPILAHFIKENFVDIEVRASVNMEIGTIEGMEYLAEDFDGYYYKRELNRNLAQVKELKKWCDAKGKKLYMLANSGCLNYCSSRQFHDNLVAHEQEIVQMDNGSKFESTCSRFLKQPDNHSRVLSYLNCVRPEDIHWFESYVTAAKLATRMSARPEMIVRSYMQGKHYGNLLELLEPNHAENFYPSIIDNTRIPTNYYEHIATCNKHCKECGYCESVMLNSCINLGDI